MRPTQLVVQIKHNKVGDKLRWKTRTASRAELESVLEDWIAIRLKDGLDLPVLDGLPTPVAA